MNAWKPKPAGGTARIVPTAPVLREREDRLDALSRLAAKLGHDFNNHLAPILGYATMIKEDAGDNGTVCQYASVVEKVARQTTERLEEMLSAVRPQRRFHPMPTDLAELVKKEVSDWQATLAATAQITVRLNVAPCRLSLDHTHWQQVVRHLLKNAHYALGTGGTLEISLEPAAMDSQAAADLGLATTENFRLTVTDNGFGMTEETLKQAFHPFFTTRPKGTAHGLGLTLVHNVVRLHGGQVVLESREDEGTTVTIWLPAHSAPAPEKASPSHRMPAPVTTGLRTGRKILVVDDDAMVREVIKTALQRANFEAIIATNGQEGLEAFRKYSKDIALIVADVAMPVLGGLEMVQKIRQSQPSVPVVFISGEITVMPPELASSGTTMLVKKPFALKGFVETIKSQLG